MKTLFAILTLLFCLNVSAQTVTLDSTPCTGTYICYEVPNSAGLQIDYISYSAHYQRLVVSLSEVVYDSGLWTVTSLQDVPLTSFLGTQIYVTLSFSEVRKPCVRSGRATICPVVVTLTSGSLQQ